MYELGQTVILRDVNGDRRWYPDGEAPTGTIAKVGRTLVHVQSDRYEWAKPDAYRLEDGSINNNHGGAWIQTVEEFKAERDRSLILAAFRAIKIDLGGSGMRTLTNDQLERMLIVAGGAS